MTIAPLFDAGFLIASHALAAMAAFLLGAFQLVAPKGTIPHKTFGYVWCVIMIYVASTSFFIHDMRTWGPFSPIHLLALFALAGVFSGVLAARRKDIKDHRKTMILLYSGALVVAGFFTLMPGRVMHNVVFGG